MPINELLKAHIEERGEGAQVALAREIGVREASVSRWVNAQAIPNDWRAATIAQALGMEEDEILAAIGLARQVRHRAELLARSRADRDEVIRLLVVQIEGLERQVGDLQQQLAVLRRHSRRRPDGPNEARR